LRCGGSTSGREVPAFQISFLNAKNLREARNIHGHWPTTCQLEFQSALLTAIRAVQF
jgi:hypothetical protein